MPKTLTILPTKNRLQQNNIICTHCGADRRAVRHMLAYGDSEEREKAARTIERCGPCAGALYLDYRQFTGKCEVCHAPIYSHPRCDACFVLCGIGHENVQSAYRGHDLCGRCLVAWKGKDILYGRETTWEEFTRPTLLPLPKDLS